jgi:hypothetical protein
MRGYMLPGYNKNIRSFEMHLPLANYAGPNTDIQKRWIEKQLHGTTQVDEAARHHDIQYYNLGLLKAQHKITDAMLNRGIYNADNQLARRASLASKNPVNAFQSLAVKAAVRAKQGLQSVGIFSKDMFTRASNPNAKLMSEDEPKFVDELPSGGRKKKKIDRLKRLRKALKKEAK